MRKWQKQLKLFQNSATFLKNGIAPPRCMGCLIEGTWLCQSCKKNINGSAKLSCIVCGKVRPRGSTCYKCRTKTPLHGVVSVGSYGFTNLRRGIHWLKFRNVTDIAEDLAGLMLDSLSVVAPASVLRRQAVIIPIPLHKRRMRERGFNQSLVLAEKMAELTAIPYDDALVRVKHTWAQAKLPNEMRQDNLLDAFELKNDKVRDKPIILLVDDVTTSGATLSEAANAIVSDSKDGNQFWGSTIARG